MSWRERGWPGPALLRLCGGRIVVRFFGGSGWIWAAIPPKDIGNLAAIATTQDG